MQPAHRRAENAASLLGELGERGGGQAEESSGREWVHRNLNTLLRIGSLQIDGLEMEPTQTDGVSLPTVVGPLLERRRTQEWGVDGHDNGEQRGRDPPVRRSTGPGPRLYSCIAVDGSDSGQRGSAPEEGDPGLLAELPAGPFPGFRRGHTPSVGHRCAEVEGRRGGGG